ncbi:MAG TPA: Pycsar system effector family protein [Thermoanaerobaculia bacterium]|nr:Pycsar system effector family protein [Thermoanaerobaculia bacterium]
MSITPQEVPPPADTARPFSTIRPRSSVDNLLRTIQQHHVQLSVMADMKANILITISSILLTIALARANDVQLRPALLTLAVACLISLVLSIYAVLPTFAAPRSQNVSRNLLFFGHFASMSEDEYFREMEDLLASDPRLYEVAVRDIHSLGVYLHRKKYRFLRFAYVALLGGFILATLVEAIFFYWRT